MAKANKHKIPQGTRVLVQMVLVGGSSGKFGYQTFFN